MKKIIRLTESELVNYIKMVIKESSSPQEQLDTFNYTEDKVKSFFIGKKKVKLWHEKLKEKYPDLNIRFQIDGDVLRAEASIKRN